MFYDGGGLIGEPAAIGPLGIVRPGVAEEYARYRGGVTDRRDPDDDLPLTFLILVGYYCTMSQINWLHLSDLHTGMTAQSWLWQRFEKGFLEDLKLRHEKSGPWDFILFTGDLVRTGSPSEFQKFDEILDTLYSHLRSLGSDPKLITLPGNHDLVRPKNLNSTVLALNAFQSNIELQQDFWGDDEAKYRSAVNAMFEPYRAWRQASVAAGRHSTPVKEGLIVGDASYIAESNGVTAKCVTLNSTWLQLTAGEFKSRLVVHPLQLISSLPEAPDSWLQPADLTIIATHQPVDWLTAEAQQAWKSEIYPTDRFDFHAFGHMHVADTKRYSRGGGGLRRELQAASLFGLEQTDAGVERLQGYSAMRFDREENRSRLTIWPRRLFDVGDDEKKIKADVSQDLDEDNKFSFPLDRNPSALSPPRKQLSPVDSFRPREEDTRRFKLENIEVILPLDAAHRAVRQAEQKAGRDAWDGKGKAFWLSSEWGLGEESFIGTISSHLGGQARCYELSIAEFSNKDSFLDQVRLTYGMSFEEICDRIQSDNGSILILADAPLRSPSTPSCNALATEIESLVYMTRDYLDEARFIITTRTAPASPSLPVVELKALDEPDIRSYVAARRPSETSLTTAPTIERLYQMTSGHPGSIDAALKQLNVVSLNELVRANTDLGTGLPTIQAPAALPAMLAQLRAEGPVGQRSYELLQSLSLFPSGEQLDRIRHIDHAKPFFPPHATALLDRHLIEAVTYSELGDNSTSNNARLLRVPRPVRDYIRTNLKPNESERLDRRTIELYFGSDWKQGLSKSSVAAGIVNNPLAPPHELHNCATILLRSLFRNKDAGNVVDLEASIRLTIAFISQMSSSGHYRSALSLCEDLLPILRSGNAQNIPFVETQRAKCLRMTGRGIEAQTLYLSIDTSSLPKAIRQEIALGLALSYNSGGRGPEARVAAERAVKINPQTTSALHARIVLAELDPPGPNRDAKLDALMQKAKARKSTILVNNIKLFKAERGTMPERQALLRDVVDSSRSSGDFYNRFRALLNLAETRTKGELISDSDQLGLIMAYHFFHNERLRHSFDRIHNILWTIFDDDGDLLNTLSLFRHSSFIWRLAGLNEEEQKYVDILRLKFESIIGSNLPMIGRERKYFLTRLQAITEA